MTNSTRRNYFVRHLPKGDPRRIQGYVFQIQAVDRHGLATAFAFFGLDDEKILIDGRSIPSAVVSSAKELGPGESRFVNSTGIEMLPSDLVDSG